MRHHLGKMDVTNYFCHIPVAHISSDSKGGWELCVGGAQLQVCFSLFCLLFMHLFLGTVYAGIWRHFCLVPLIPHPVFHLAFLFYQTSIPVTWLFLLGQARKRFLLLLFLTPACDCSTWFVRMLPYWLSNFNVYCSAHILEKLHF